MVKKMKQTEFNVNNDNLLIVDDDPITCEVLYAALSDHFNIKITNSGEECLQAIGDFQPKLVILDIDMPGINGYETCRRLRESKHDMPVIFLSACDSLEERLEAFDSGGNDFLTKPTDHQLILRKAQLAIKAKMDKDQIASEKDSYEQMAMTFLDSMGESGVLQNFTRLNFDCPDYATLLTNTLQACQHLSLQCHIQLRFPGGSLSCTPDGKAGPLEESVLTQVASLGRLFQFKKRLVTNYEHVTIIILNMPDNTDIAGRIRDNIAVLAEITEAFVNAITLRAESATSAERIRKANLSAGSAIEILRAKYRNQQIETRLLQDDLIHEVEKTYIHLGLTDSQEFSISEVLYKNAEKILFLFEQSEEFEAQFAIILNALKPEAST
jgi:CheY-like chemotaxis protein